MSSRRKPRKKSRYSRGGKIKRDEHHVYPRSRKKIEDLGKFKPFLSSLTIKTEITKHVAWHNVFHNLFSEEAISLVKKSFKAGFKSLPEIISFIKRGFYPNQTIPETTKNDLNDWRKIFGQRQNPNCRWIKKFILRNWTYPGVKAVVSGKKIVKVMIYLEKISKTNRIIKNIHKCKNVKILENGKLLKIT